MTEQQSRPGANRTAEDAERTFSLADPTPAATRCARCHRRLTRPSSTIPGVGPKCALRLEHPLSGGLRRFLAEVERALDAGDDALLHAVAAAMRATRRGCHDGSLRVSPPLSKVTLGRVVVGRVDLDGLTPLSAVGTGVR